MKRGTALEAMVFAAPSLFVICCYSRTDSPRRHERFAAARPRPPALRPCTSWPGRSARGEPLSPGPSSPNLARGPANGLGRAAGIAARPRGTSPPYSDREKESARERTHKRGRERGARRRCQGRRTSEEGTRN